MYYLLKILADFFQEYKITISVYFIILFISQPISTIVIPKIFSKFLDELSLHKNSSYETLKPIIIKYITYISIGKITTSFLGFIAKYLEDKIIPNFIGYLNTFMFTNLLKQRENNFSEIDISTIYMYLVDVPKDVLLLLKNVVTMIPNILTLISVVVYFTYLNVGLGLITLSLYIIILYLSSLAIPICLPLAKEKQNSEKEKLVIINNKLSNLTNIFSSGYMKEEIDDFKNIVNENKKKII
jgi:ABC-type multidrug transport system fused ATPase/permease subunit